MKKLTTRKVISIHGEGVLAFLQGLITQDTQLLSRSGGKTAIASLFLNPKGRVISDALIVKRGSAEEPQGVFLDVPSVHADKIANLLTRHKLRLPMSIEKAENQSVFVTNDSDFSFEDPRVPSLPRRCLSPCEPGVVDTIQDVDFERERLMAGVVEGQDLPPDSIPIFYNFDFFNCISFNKGCYTGQELITRTLRRGIVRRRVVPLKTVDGSSIKQGGKVFSDGSREIGTIFACARDVGLAVLQLDSPQGLNEKPAYRTALLSAGTLTIDHEVSVCLVVPKMWLCRCGAVSSRQKSSELERTETGLSEEPEKTNVSNPIPIIAQEQLLNRLRILAQEQNRTSGTHVRSASRRRLLLNDFRETMSTVH